MADIVEKLNEEHKYTTSKWYTKWLLTIVAGSLFALDLLLKYIPGFFNEKLFPKDGGIDVVGLALVFLALLPWISDYLTSAKIPGGLEVAFKQIEEKQEITQDYVEQLRFIVKGFMTIHEYHHLQDIKSGKPYTVKPQHSVPLASELRRLRALGLIEQKAPDRGVTDFVIADGQERKPSDWFTLTKLGEEYLKMREEK